MENEFVLIIKQRNEYFNKTCVLCRADSFLTMKARRRIEAGDSKLMVIVRMGDEDDQNIIMKEMGEHIRTGARLSRIRMTGP